jgi:hypothetical protein
VHWWNELRHNSHNVEERMPFQQQTIHCPKCGEKISIDAVLTQQIEAQIRSQFETEKQAKESAIAQREAQLQKESEKLTDLQKNIDSTVAERLSAQLSSEKTRVTKEAQLEAEREQRAKTAFLEEQLKNKDEKLAQAQKHELELRKEKMRLEDEKKAFELEKIRQLDEAKQSIVEEASKRATEEQQHVIAQLRKQLTDATKAKDDLARKLEQGSQQLQGEVLELALEEILKTEFPFDEITPVPKGVSGADIIQKVFDRSGRLCGQIVWESKQTKTWSDGWIQKLKDDQRTIKADIAVIISAAMPDGVKGFTFRDGIWICDIKLSTALASALRINLEGITREKAMAVGKNEKMEFLYAYLTGVEFKQRVEAIVEAFTSMDASLRKERIAYEKMWAEREKQIKKVITNTVGMYGDLSGLVTLPHIKTLELEVDSE